MLWFCWFVAQTNAKSVEHLLFGLSSRPFRPASPHRAQVDQQVIAERLQHHLPRHVFELLRHDELAEEPLQVGEGALLSSSKNSLAARRRARLPRALPEAPRLILMPGSIPFAPRKLKLSRES